MSASASDDTLPDEEFLMLSHVHTRQPVGYPRLSITAEVSENEGTKNDVTGGCGSRFDAGGMRPELCGNAGRSSATASGDSVRRGRSGPELRVDRRLLGPSRRTVALGRRPLGSPAAATRDLGKRVLGAARRKIPLARWSLALAVLTLAFINGLK